MIYTRHGVEVSIESAIDAKREVLVREIGTAAPNPPFLYPVDRLRADGGIPEINRALGAHKPESKL